ncbi:MAG TPA: hypothetical protein P5250_05240 [Bacteroidales bacterium]|nr:hypothetical protein [Bacteroidales bacterium]
MLKIKIILKAQIILLFFFVINTNAESLKKDTITYKGLYIGFNIGSYFANRYTANYYNGLDSSGSVSYKVLYIFQYQQNYDRIKQVLGGYDFQIDEMPSNMHFNPSAYIGINAKYNFTNKDAFFIQANYSKVKTNDIFTLKLLQPQYSSPEANLYKANIWGVEDRINFDLGYGHSFHLFNNVYFGIETGININSVRVKESKIQIENLQFSIKDPYYDYYNIIEGGINIGGLITGNLQFWLNQTLSLEPSFTCYYSKINLGDNKKYMPQLAIFTRLIYKN